jgi:UDP-2,4-diacetamido-2,4,6-trideoxy-beta-L-altropyranose hydrolase
MLIVRADADAKIGTGHLMRCLALAQSWSERGGEATFVTNCENAGLRERLKGEGFAVVQVESSYPHESDLATTRAVLKRYPNAWCVVDGYHFDAGFHRFVRKCGNRALVVDDTAGLEFYDADAILNQNINAEKLEYNCAPETVLLRGTRYAMLRREFWQWQNFERETPAVARKILITMGGGDFHNQTLKAMRAIEQTGIENLEVKAVVGASNPHLSILENVAENSPIRIELIRATQNMAGILAESDLAISAAGSTCWEMAFMRLPSVLIVTADNQTAIAAGLDNAGFAANLGWFERISENDLAQTLSEILFNPERRAAMSRRGREIVDGRGAERVVEALRENA